MISSSSNVTASRASAIVNLSHLSSPSVVECSLVKNSGTVLLRWSHPRWRVCWETPRTCSSSSWWTPSRLSCKNPCTPEPEKVLSEDDLTDWPVNPPQLHVSRSQHSGGPGSPVDQRQLPKATALTERHDLGLVNEDVHRPLRHQMLAGWLWRYFATFYGVRRKSYLIFF